VPSGIYLWWSASVGSSSSDEIALWEGAI